MKISEPEPRRTSIISGNKAPGKPCRSESLASSHPFIQQLDLVIATPSDAAFDVRPIEVSSKYWSCTCTLAKFVEFARSSIEKYSQNSDFGALGIAGSNTDDVWSLDGRGMLTLGVSKATYQKLGIIGQKLPWKGCNDIYIISLSLFELETPSIQTAKYKRHYLGPKQMQALRTWDAQRGPWRVVYYLNEETASIFDRSTEHAMAPKTTNLSNIYVPALKLTPCPTDTEEREDWQEEVSTLFEWVGMACLGAQRLRINDKVDPYLAVYIPPTSSRVGSVSHIRWTGLLSPAFVSRILSAATYASLSHVSSTKFWHSLHGRSFVQGESFVSLTAHGVPTTPVAYLPSSPSDASTLRAPRPEAEDTWSLIVSNVREESEQKSYDWMLAESIGQWDARCG
ncbi:uncharacterized protein LAESUDRAFT_812290, partial [Laetiporus sulphureus 93-53]